jgi:ligand-binding SRPBCC domain-containing protein
LVNGFVFTKIGANDLNQCFHHDFCKKTIIKNMNPSKPLPHALRIRIVTRVSQPLAAVWKGFDQSLFKALAPPFPPVRVLRFDGCAKGDIVSLELNFILGKTQWTSLITDSKEASEECFFIDEGTKLPPFLAYWRHKHLMQAAPGGGTLIIDDIQFAAPFGLLSYVMYPALWLQFLYRKPIYKRLFK